VTPPALSPFLGALLILALLAADCLRVYNTDRFRRRLFVALLCFAAAFVLAGFAAGLLDGAAGRPSRGGLVRAALFAAASAAAAFRAAAVCLAAIFLDYFVHGDARGDVPRARFQIRAAVVYLALFAGALVVNVPAGFFFTVAPSAALAPAGFFWLIPIVTGLPPLAALLDALRPDRGARRGSRLPRPARLAHLGRLAALTALAGGAALGPFPAGGSAQWSCWAVVLLFYYFSVVRADARIDILTGIANRDAFNEFISRLARPGIPGLPAPRPPEPWSVVLIDMDHFKEINDTLGHAEGDNALRDMAAVIRRCARGADFAARYGGDEFVIAARGEGDPDAVVTRLRGALAAHNRSAGRPYRLEVSCGCGVFTPGAGQRVEEFMARIDGLMYGQKAGRRAGDG